MRCFWIPRPRPAVLAAAPVRTVRRTIVATAATAAPRAVPAVRRTAGLMLVCVAGALPALELLRLDVPPDPIIGAAASAPVSADTVPRLAAARSTPIMAPLPQSWAAETGLFAPVPRLPFPIPLPGVPLAFGSPTLGVPSGLPLSVPLGGVPPTGPTPPGPKPWIPQPWAGPPAPTPEPSPEGGDPFVFTGAPPSGTPIPVPGAATLLLGALGLGLLLVPPGGRARRGPG